MPRSRFFSDDSRSGRLGLSEPAPRRAPQAEPSPDSEANRDLVNNVARLYRSDDPKAREKGEELLKELAPSVPITAWQAVGLGEAAQQFSEGERSWLDKTKGFAGRVLGPVFQKLDAPSQAVLHGIDAASGPQNRGSVFGAAWKGFTDSWSGREPPINLREALDKDPASGGRLLGAFDLIGTTALDPVTYASLGTSAAARGAASAGGRALATRSGVRATAEVAGREAAEAAATSRARQEVLKRVLAEAGEEGAGEGAQAALQIEARQAARQAGQAQATVRGTEAAATRALERHNLGRATRELGLEGSRRERVSALKDALKDDYIRLGMPEKDAARRAAFDVSPAALGKPKLIPGVLDSVPGARAGADKLRERTSAVARAADPNRIGRKLFIPDEGLRRTQGESTARAVRASRAEAEAHVQNVAGTLQTRLSQLIKKGKFTKEDEALALDALDEPYRMARADRPEQAFLQGRDDYPVAVQQLIDQFETAGQTRKADVVRELHHMRWDADQALLEAGVSPAQLHDVSTYVRRTLTPEGQRYNQALSSSTDAPGALFGNKADPTRLFKRNPELRDKGIRETNEIIAASNADAPEQAFDESVISVGLRSRVEAERILAQNQHLDMVANSVFDPSGKPLLIREIRGPVPSKKPQFEHDLLEGTEDYVDMDLGDALGHVKVHQSIADEVRDYHAIVYNDRALEATSQFFEKWMKLWRGYATVPLVAGTGFTMRNATGNVFNAYLMGVRNPQRYVQAGRMQSALYRAERRGVKITEDVLVNAFGKDNPETRELARIVMQARDKGIIGSSFFRSDVAGLGPGALDEFMPGRRAAAQRARRRFNPLNLKNFVLATGAQMNSVVEDNARIALFYDQMLRHGDAEAAKDTVHRALFDYGDLTAAEQKLFRNVIPFYTFMRKNTPFIFSELARDPGKLLRVQRAQRSIFGSGEEAPKDDNGLDRFLPDYVREGQVAPATGGLFAGLGGEKGTPFVGAELPLNAAVETAAPFVELAAQAPVLDQVLPDEWKNDEGFQGIARTLVNLPGGGPNELARFLLEEATGVDMFTAGPTKTDDMDRFYRFADMFAPIISKTHTTVNDMSDPDKRKVRLLRNILGLNTTLVTDQASSSARYGVIKEIEEDIKSLKDQGVEVPTLDEMRRLGVVPRLRPRSSYLFEGPQTENVG